MRIYKTLRSCHEILFGGLVYVCASKSFPSLNTAMHPVINQNAISPAYLHELLQLLVQRLQPGVRSCHRGPLGRAGAPARCHHRVELVRAVGWLVEAVPGFKV